MGPRQQGAHHVRASINALIIWSRSVACRRLRYRRAVSTATMCVPQTRGRDTNRDIHPESPAWHRDGVPQHCCAALADRYARRHGGGPSGAYRRRGQRRSLDCAAAGQSRGQKARSSLAPTRPGRRPPRYQPHQRHEQARTRDEVKHGLMGVVLCHRSAVQTAPQAYPVVHGFVSQHGSGGFREGPSVEAAVITHVGRSCGNPVVRAPGQGLVGKQRA